jgi:hypothetical protein
MEFHGGDGQFKNLIEPKELDDPWPEDKQFRQFAVVQIGQRSFGDGAMRACIAQILTAFDRYGTISS